MNLDERSITEIRLLIMVVLAHANFSRAQPSLSAKDMRDAADDIIEEALRAGYERANTRMQRE
jgi:hypothetical protein